MALQGGCIIIGIADNQTRKHEVIGVEISMDEYDIFCRMIRSNITDFVPCNKP